MAKSCLQVAPCRHVNSKQAARDVNHVSVLDIFWSYWLAANGWAKINGLRMLYPIDYASEVNIAWASIVAYPAGLHDRLVHRGRSVKTDRTRFVGKSGYGHGCHAVLQRDQHFVVFELPFVAADELILKIDYPLVGGRDFADKRETHLAVPANFLRLVWDALFSIGNLITSLGVSL